MNGRCFVTAVEKRDSRGIPILRHELLVRINSAIHPAEISSVLLKEILIQ